MDEPETNKKWVAGFMLWIAIGFAWLRPCFGETLRPEVPAPVYVSWLPMEPDKCIAAWLIQTHVHPDARFRFMEKGAPITEGIPFDVPGSDYMRNHRQCASEVVLEKHGITNAEARAAANLARRIEISYWCATFTDEEQPLVDRLKGLQAEDEVTEDKLREAFEGLSRAFGPRRSEESPAGENAHPTAP